MPNHIRDVASGDHLATETAHEVPVIRAGEHAVVEDRVHCHVSPDLDIAATILLLNRGKTAQILAVLWPTILGESWDLA